MRKRSIPTLSLCLLVAAACGETMTEPDVAGVAAARASADNPGAARNIIRFSTFNASLNRFNAGDLISDLSTPNNAQAQTVAEIIQQARLEAVKISLRESKETIEKLRSINPGMLLMARLDAESWGKAVK